MDEVTKLERDFQDVNIQIVAIANLLSELESKREKIYDQLQEAIANRPTQTDRLNKRYTYPELIAEFFPNVEPDMLQDWYAEQTITTTTSGSGDQQPAALGEG